MAMVWTLNLPQQFFVDQHDLVGSDRWEIHSYGWTPPNATHHAGL